MNVLLDTHAFLWFVQDDPKLSNAARGLLNILGYRSNKTLKIAPNNAQQFQAQFDANGHPAARKWAKA